MKQCNSYQLHFRLNCWLHLAQCSAAKHHAIFQLKGPDVFGGFSRHRQLWEMLYLHCNNHKNISSRLHLHTHVLFQSLFSNAPLNYTEHRQCQTPIAPNLLLHCVKQQPSNPAPLIRAYTPSLLSLHIMLLLLNTYQNIWFQDHVPFFFPFIKLERLQ